ncbi:YncE family protein [Gemmatimonas sp.]|uniref:YncE family protein n=2 Tax=Gemmatimonas sp. TaxID=1962908 RepID=UPI00356A0312
MRAVRQILALAATCCVAASACYAPRRSADAGDKLYIVNQSGASITVVDQARLAIDTVLDLRTLGFTANAKPHHVVVEENGAYWYVSLIGDGRVLKFDRANRLLAQLELETPGLLSLDPVHDSLYVGRSMTAVNPPKSLGVIVRSTFTLVDEQEIVMPRPHALASSIDGRFVHTASLAENRIASVETATGRVTLSVIAGIPRSLVTFALSPDGQTMVSAGELSNSLLVFDLRRPPPLQPVREIALEGKPWEPRFTPDGKHVLVTLLTKNAIADVDLALGTVVRTLSGRLAQPYSMLLRRDGRYAFVVSQNTGATAPGQSGHEMHAMGAQEYMSDGWLTIFDLRSGQVHSTLMLGAGPTGMGAAGAR